MNRQSSRRGNYSMIMGLAITAMLGFAAISVDISYVRLAQSQAQDVADAASQAGLLVLKSSAGNLTASRAAAEVVALNRIVGDTPTLTSLDFGYWDVNDDSATFDGTSTHPNAVRANVRASGAGVPMLFGPLFGWNTVGVTQSAVSATRSLQVVLSMDITGSWHQNNFKNARLAALEFLDVVTEAPHEDDVVGMNIWTMRYAWEYTPLTNLADTSAMSAVRTDWGKLNVASKAGKFEPTWVGLASKSLPCTLNASPNKNNFTVGTVGGCYPDMPREYTDEPGTDHTVGVGMSRNMFEAAYDPTAYRALLVLTDGQPNGIAANTIRNTAKYSESRWTQYVGPVPHTTAQVKSESQIMAQDLYDDLDVNIWVVSFVSSDAFMAGMAKGDGTYQVTSSSAALIDIFRNIAESMPLAVVE